MASAMSGIASATRLLNTLCDLVKVTDSLGKIYGQVQQGDNDLEKASLVFRLISLGCSIAEVGMVISGQKSEKIAILKQVQVVNAIMKVPTEFFTEWSRVGQLDTWSKVARLVEKGALAPTADLFRLVAQGQRYGEQAFLEMTPEELKEAKRPIYKYTPSSSIEEPGTLEIIGYKPVDLEECKKNIEEADRHDLEATTLRTATELGVIEKSVKGGECLYDVLLDYLRPMPPQNPPAQQNPPIQNNNQNNHQVQNLPVQNQQAPQIHRIELDLNLRNYPRIPLPLHNDQLFRQFICPITQEPIRDPVRDPTTNNKVMYERSAIENWLRVRGTSPLTTLPLQIHQLTEAPAIKAMINRRLREHTESIEQHLQQIAALPVSPQDQQIIDQQG